MADGGATTVEQEAKPAENSIKVIDNKAKVKKSESTQGKRDGESHAITVARRQEKATKAWEKHYEKLGKKIHELDYEERQAVRMAIQGGWGPEAVVRVIVDNLPPDMPPEILQLVTSANEMLDVIPPDAADQQIATLEQALLKLSKLDIPEDVREAVRSSLRQAIVNVYEPIEEDEFAISKQDQGNAKERVKPSVDWVVRHSELSDLERLVAAKKLLDEEVPQEYEEALAKEKEKIKENPAHNILIGAQISVPQRLAQVEADLHRPLTRRESALLRAHYASSGQKGKNDIEDASVYNLKPEQLRERVEILGEKYKENPNDENEKEKVVYNSRERRLLIQEGLAAVPIDSRGITHPGLTPIVNQINTLATRLGSEQFPADFLEGQIRRVQGLIDNLTVTPDQGNHLLDILTGRLAEVKVAGERSGWYLFDSDRRDLVGGRDKVIEWLNEQFKRVYTTADQGQEQTSPQLQTLQQVFQEASRFVGSYYRGLEKTHQVIPGTADALAWELGDGFNVRLNMLYGRTAIDSRNIDQMVAAAGRAKAEGLGKAMNLDKGRVLWFFNRANEALEDMRLREGGLEKHITPQMLKNLSEIIKNDQIKLAKLGMGLYAAEYRRVAADVAVHQQHLIDNEGSRDEEGNLRLGEDGLPIRRLTPAEIENRVVAVTKQDMLRSERTALDILVFTQRVAVLNARGDFPRGEHLRRSSPGGGLPYNLLVTLAGPGQKFTAEGEAMLDEVMKNMAEHHLKDKGVKNPKNIPDLVRKDLGERLLSTIYSPSDFFSSGWRCATLKQQIEDYFIFKKALTTLPATDVNGRRDPNRATFDEIQQAIALIKSDELGYRRVKKQAEQFGLFVRLHTAKTEGAKYGRDEKTQRKLEWEKIANYRPEEIMRLFRDKAPGEKAFLDVFNREPFATMFPVTAQNPKEIDLRGQKDHHGHHYNYSAARRAEIREQQVASWRYDQFKLKYGNILSTLRTNALGEDTPRQFDAGRLTPAEQQQVNDFFSDEPGAAQRLMEIYGIMKNAITMQRAGADGISVWLRPEHAPYETMIDALLDDSRFTDIYERTLMFDDTLIDKLETVHENSGMIALSKVWSNELGADALVRNFVDVQDGALAQKAFGKFLDTADFQERMKSLKEAGDAVHSMNGADTRVDLYRYAVGTLLTLAKKDWFWDTLNVEKLLFQMPSSKLEKLIGPHAKPMGRDELLHIMNSLRNEFTKHADEESLVDKYFLPPAAREKLRHERHENAEKIMKEFKHDLEITPLHVAHRKFWTLFIYFLFGAIIESFDSLKSEAGLKAA